MPTIYQTHAFTDVRGNRWRIGHTQQVAKGTKHHYTVCGVDEDFLIIDGTRDFPMVMEVQPWKAGTVIVSFDSEIVPALVLKAPDLRALLAIQNAVEYLRELAA